MKNKLYYTIFWESKREKTWSGTALSLKNSLQNYFDIVDFNKNPPFILPFSEKIYERIHMLTFYTLTMKLAEMSFHIRYPSNQRKTILSFDEAPAGKNIDNYIYQDLCLEYMKNLSETNPELFELTHFQKALPYTFKKRLKLQRERYKSAAGIFTMSHWLQQYIIENYDVDPSKVHYTGGGSNLDFSRIAPKEKNNRRILFVGRDFERKAGPLVVDAFKILKEKYDPLAELYVAGPNENPVDGNVDGYHYLNDLSYDELSEYFNLCDIFVMPSKFEAYGLVFIEALAYGLPCIGRNAYEMPYFIEKGVTGDLIDDDNPDVLAEKMYNLLLNEEIKRNVTDKRQWYIEEYSWNTVASRMFDIIEKNKN